MALINIKGFVFIFVMYIVLLQIRTKAALFQHSFGPRRDTLVYFFGMAVLFYGAIAASAYALCTAYATTTPPHFF